jgi:hypothetical protein
MTARIVAKVRPGDGDDELTRRQAAERQLGS